MGAGNNLQGADRWGRLRRFLDQADRRAGF